MILIVFCNFSHQTGETDFHVDLFTMEAPLGGSEVCYRGLVFQITCGWWHYPTQDVMNNAREEASILGANAIVDISMHNSRESALFHSYCVSLYGTAVHYTKPNDE